MSKKKTFVWALESVLQKDKPAKRNSWTSGHGSAESIILNPEKDGFIMHMSGGANIPWTPNGNDIFADDWAEA